MAKTARQGEMIIGMGAYGVAEPPRMPPERPISTPQTPAKRAHSNHAMTLHA